MRLSTDAQASRRYHRSLWLARKFGRRSWA